MIETEYIRSVQSNYERVHLPEKPDDYRYQYCILTRGGVKGLLPCSLRYINGQAYLYYDITSKQNLAQMCRKEMIDRNWMKDFFWSYSRVKQELSRFLLDDKNLLFQPEHIFQDIGNRNFFFLYLPYSEEENGMSQLMEFMLEHMDYEDERLVECVYSMYEQYERMGEVYLGQQIFADIEKLEVQENTSEEETEFLETAESEAEDIEELQSKDTQSRQEKKYFWQRLGEKRKQADKQKATYRARMYEAMEGVAVAEEIPYDEEYGQTIYVEQPIEGEKLHKLYTPDGRVAAVLEQDSFMIGKQKDIVNLVLEDESVSRIHARIYKEDEMIYLEDLNATNGTYKNGIRLQPYEKRRLEEDDEIRIGKLLFIYR